MRILRVEEHTLLELAAYCPFSYLPSNHRWVVERLRRHGLLLEKNGEWYPTTVGLAALGYTLH
jgi:hypothetical protein